MVAIEETEPYAGAPSADFIEGDGAVYALIGTLVKNVDQDGHTSHHLLAGDVLTSPIDERMVPLFKWFNTPRSESQVQEWLVWADAPEKFLSALLEGGLIAKVNSSSAWKAAKSLRGFRLVPLCFPDHDTQVPEGLLAVKRNPDSRGDGAVTAELAELLWVTAQSEDIPQAIATMAQRLGVGRESVARIALVDVPMLIDYGFIRLEPLRG